MPKKPNVDIFTDGSVIPKSGGGGWAVRMKMKRGIKHIRKDADGEIVGGSVTPQQAEMIAVIAGLNMLKESCVVIIHTDSLYMIRDYKRVTSGDTEGLSLVTLWERVVDAAREHEITWTHVKAHRGDPDNESCDHRAKKHAFKVHERMENKR